MLASSNKCSDAAWSFPRPRTGSAEMLADVCRDCAWPGANGVLRLPIYVQGYVRAVLAAATERRDWHHHAQLSGLHAGPHWPPQQPQCRHDAAAAHVWPPHCTGQGVAAAQ